MTTWPGLVSKAAQLHALMEQGVFTGPDGEVLPEAQGLAQAMALLQETRQRDGRLYLVGNGGSNAVIAHVANDFIKNGHFLVHTLHDPATLTCLANDYGYEEAYRQALAILARPGDLLVAVSSSGRSPNILNAARAMIEAGGRVMTCTGFAPENPLRRAGIWNYWLPSHHYGHVEIAHLVLLHHLAECLALPATV